uniref:Uncharacterized protein n=1 Tax=Pseudo-nitzschia delicatissima TaxID=44447 RepID=A0A7S0UJQ1_9STRA
MISVRSSMTRSIVGGRSTPNAGAAFLQANLPFPSSSSDEAKNNNSSPTVRRFVAPAYRRYLNRQQFLKENTRGLKPSIGARAPGIQKPSLEVAKDMGRSFSEMENDPLMVIAEIGSHSARCEVLKRHIMCVDEVDYDTAGKTLEELTAKSLEGLSFYTLPYKVGITLAVVAGVGAIPMVFDISTAMSFNAKFVTMDTPPPSDLDTVLETGAWTWNWMEPLTGTLSFSLLAFQYARQQFLNLGIKPFTQRVLHRRSQILINAYPQYNDRLLANFVESHPMSNN